MHMPALNAKGLTELMMPLNRTALFNFNELTSAMGRVPGAVASGLTVNAQSNLASLTKTANDLIGATQSRDPLGAVAKTVLLAEIPSAAGEFRRRAVADDA
jgi:hypothetical protein